MKMRAACAFIAGLFVGYGGPAFAGFLDFDNPPVSFQQAYSDGASYIEDGYAISTVSAPGHFGSVIRFNPYAQSTLVSNNGTVHMGITLFANPWLQKVDGGTFALISLDVAEYSQSVTWPRSFDLTGHRANGSTLTASLPLDRVFDGAGGVDDFQHYTLNWTNLVRVDFTSPGVTFDNL